MKKKVLRQLLSYTLSAVSGVCLISGVVLLIV